MTTRTLTASEVITVRETLLLAAARNERSSAPRDSDDEVITAARQLCGHMAQEQRALAELFHNAAAVEVRQ